MGSGKDCGRAAHLAHAHLWPKAVSGSWSRKTLCTFKASSGSSPGSEAQGLGVRQLWITQTARCYGSLASLTRDHVAGVSWSNPRKATLRMPDATPFSLEAGKGARGSVLEALLLAPRRVLYVRVQAARSESIHALSP